MGLAIRVVPFLALHKNPRIKADSDLISASLKNTGRREDIRLSDGRHQKAVFPKASGFKGFKPPPGLRPWAALGSARNRLRLPGWFSGEL